MVASVVLPYFLLSCETYSDGLDPERLGEAEDDRASQEGADSLICIPSQDDVARFWSNLKAFDSANVSGSVAENASHALSMRYQVGFLQSQPG